MRRKYCTTDSTWLRVRMNKEVKLISREDGKSISMMRMILIISMSPIDAMFHTYAVVTHDSINAPIPPLSFEVMVTTLFRKL